LFLMALLNTGTAVARIVWTMDRLPAPATPPRRVGAGGPPRGERRVSASSTPALRGQPNQAG
jgi:hypothetical protein